MFFHRTNLFGKAGKIALFRIARFQIPERFNVLLDPIGAIHLDRHRSGLNAILHPIAAKHDGDGHRDDPQSCQCHPPVERKQAQRNDHGGDQGTEQAGNKVRAGLFQNLTVRHDGTGQIGQISFAKERQW